LLPALSEEHREASWSPDGSRLAYSAQIGAGRRRELFISDSAKRTAAINLTQGRVYAPSFLRWSPDGSRIAFSSAVVLADGRLEQGGPSPDAEGDYAPPDDELFVIDVESTELTRITDNDVLDLAPAWSPDGASLLFSSDRDGDFDLWLVSLDPALEARNLIDDNADPHDDALGDWYWGPR
jgi:TolB protein